MAEKGSEGAALLLVDLQSSGVGMIDKDAQAMLSRNLKMTLDMVAAIGWPVVVTSNMEAGVNGAVLDVIERTAPDAHAARVQRSGAFDAFRSADFADAVVETGCKTLLIAGFPLDVPVTLTALSAIERGHDVRVLVNCCGSPSGLAADLAIRRLERAGVLPTTSISAIAEIASGFDTPAGQAMMRVMMEHIVFSDAGPME